MPKRESREGTLTLLSRKDDGTLEEIWSQAVRLVRGPDGVWFNPRTIKVPPFATDQTVTHFTVVPKE